MTTDPSEEVLSHLYKVFWDDTFTCGCGDPQAAYKLTWRIVKHFNDKDSNLERQMRLNGFTDRISLILGTDPADLRTPLPTLDDMLPDPGVRQIVIGAVDALGLIDHGASFYSSWATDKGKWFLWAVEQVGGIEDLDDKLDYVGFPQHDNHGPCTDACWKIPV